MSLKAGKCHSISLYPLRKLIKSDIELQFLLYYNRPVRSVFRKQHTLHFNAKCNIWTWKTAVLPNNTLQFICYQGSPLAIIVLSRDEKNQLEKLNFLPFIPCAWGLITGVKINYVLCNWRHSAFCPKCGSVNWLKQHCGRKLTVWTWDGYFFFLYVKVNGIHLVGNTICYSS